MSKPYEVAAFLGDIKAIDPYTNILHQTWIQHLAVWTDEATTYTQINMVKFRWKWGDKVAPEDRHAPPTYLVFFIPPDDPETEDINESENAEYVQTISWTDWDTATESPIYEINPLHHKELESGEYRLLPFEVESKDRVLRGSFEIPEGWTDIALSFKNKTTGQDLGTFENLEPGAETDVKIYDSPDDFFSDEEMEQNQAGTLDDAAKNQEATFARDPENPRKIEFGMVFDAVGEVEIKLTFGPNQTEGIVTHTLTADAEMADFVTTMNERVASIEVPGSEELPIDLDGDGIPDGPGLNDLLQARQPGSMAVPGAFLHEDLEDDPLNLVLRINDDDDDGNGQPDNGDTVIDPADNDVSRLLLKRPGNLAANVGTLTLTVTGGNAVRVFNSAGSAVLSNYTVDLANPTGDLTGLAAGSVPIYVEGLAEAPDVAFTLTYRDAQNVVVTSDAVHLTVAGSSRFALLRMMGGMYALGTTQIKMRTYAANGAATWETITLAPIGENPPLQNRGMLSKVFWDVTKRSVQSQLAWTKGFVDGFWVALKGEKDTVVGVWTFFRDDPFGRSAAMFGAVREAIGELQEVPIGEIPGLLSTISKNLWEDIYTQSEQALPWAPVDPPPALVLKYMEGFAAGTIAEGVAVTLLGVGVVTKSATVIKGIIASAKTGRYALTMLSALRKSTAKTTHILMRLAKSEEGSIHFGSIGKRLEKVELPSGKKVPEVFDEALRDKPNLADAVVGNWNEAWPDITDEARRATRYQKCAHRLAELKDIMGEALSDDALESFSKLQPRLFVDPDIDEGDVFNQFVDMFDAETAAGKTKLNQFLEESKSIVEDAQSNLPNTDLPYPPSNGFAGTPTLKSFNVGDELDRYGDIGNWLAEGDPPHWARSLPSSSSPTKYRYRVKKAFTKPYGRTAPWYGKPGGGLQVYLDEGSNAAAFFAEHLEEIID